ncbi:hypothetical protein TNCV_1048891 [Trichonephila clavipes]|nr:hypothetical protein TNCV_1048891 [Trichonephila clavipes]
MNRFPSGNEQNTENTSQADAKEENDISYAVPVPSSSEMRNIMKKAHEIHHGKGLDVRLPLALAFEHHTGYSTFWLGSTPILRENTLGVVKSLPCLFLSTNLTKGLAARRLFRVPLCRKGPIHLQTSMSSPEFEPRLYGTAVRVANHYTGLAAGGIERKLVKLVEQSEKMLFKAAAKRLT